MDTETLIEERAFKAYPKPKLTDCGDILYDFDANRREGYIKACEEYESLPKIYGWVDYVDRSDGFGPIFYTEDGEIIIDLPDTIDFEYSGKPIAVELLIRKV